MAFLCTYLHFFSAMALVAVLVSEFVVLCCGPVGESSLKLLKKMDFGYGISAVVLVVTGAARIYYEKGWEYYEHNMFFLTGVALFVGAGIVSIYPTLRFIRAKQEGDINAAGSLNIRKLVMVQLVLIAATLFCMIAMAQGIG